jgi:chemotaxis protein histidine kinase CheA
VACDVGDDGTGIKYFDVRVRVLEDGIISNANYCVFP